MTALNQFPICGICKKDIKFNAARAKTPKIFDEMSKTMLSDHMKTKHKKEIKKKI